MHAYIHACMHTYMHTCMNAHIHTYIHAYIRTYMHTYVHTYIRTYIHMYHLSTDGVSASVCAISTDHIQLVNLAETERDTQRERETETERDRDRERQRERETGHKRGQCHWLHDARMHTSPCAGTSCTQLHACAHTYLLSNKAVHDGIQLDRLIGTVTARGAKYGTPALMYRVHPDVCVCARARARLSSCA
jgi:hypothetical protein